MIKIKKILKNVSSLVGMCLLLGVISSQAAPTVINTNDAGFGSLRQAILDATTSSAAATIDFDIPTTDLGYDTPTNRFTITLLTPLPNIPLAPLTINNIMGRGVTVKGGSSFRVFTTVNSAVLVINNLTISNGNSTGVGNLAKGGGIFMGDSSTVTLNKCVVTGNTAANGGGGIWMNNSGTLHVNDSTISNNTTTSGDGGGIRIFDSGTLNITRSTVSGNHADAAAPLGSGGGIYNGVFGTVNATNITVNGNTAGNLGGGINTNATATLTSSTITGNTAAVNGGGIYNGPTFTATLNNTLVALSTSAGSSRDLLGAFTATYCLVGNSEGSTVSGANNQLGSTNSPIDPRIGALKDNGGPTFTRALHNRSPALDKGKAFGLITDQRGETRPYDNLLIPNAPAGDGSDIGAFERTFTPTLFDFDGDGKTDPSVYRPSAGDWYLLNTKEGFRALHFGLPSDVLVPADYTGDGKTDIAVWRPSDSTWYILRSDDNTFYGAGFGANGDIPVPGDHDGDGKADLVVIRPGASQSYWFLQQSTAGFSVVPFGLAGDVPTIGDYDGDGKHDVAVFRPSAGAWFRFNSSDGSFVGLGFGISTDKVVPADYTGDGKTDLAVFRPSNNIWYILRSQDNSLTGGAFGSAGDIPSPGDYDGDGKTDLAVYRPGATPGAQSVFYVLQTTAGFNTIPWGIREDKPVPNAYVY